MTDFGSREGALGVVDVVAAAPEDMVVEEGRYFLIDVYDPNGHPEFEGALAVLDRGRLLVHLAGSGKWSNVDFSREVEVEPL